MKHEKRMNLNVLAFGIAGGILGIVMSFLMGGGSSMMGPGFAGYGMMGGISGGGIWGVSMGIFTGILAGLFATLYNWFDERTG